MHVNIYTKSTQPSKLMPVMVFIHGGGFLSGSGKTDLFGPDYFMQKDVVLVTLNYRLHVFGKFSMFYQEQLVSNALVVGFLSLADKELGVPGNAGLKDQTFALKWINRNIQNFGGDPKNITVFGESAGGASTHYHTISNHSKGLFQRAIPMSGTALSNVWSRPTKYDPKDAESLATKLGWNGKGGEKAILQLLENADPLEILKAYESLLYTGVMFKVFLVNLVFEI